MAKIYLSDPERKITIMSDDNQSQDAIVLFEYSENGDEYLFVVTDDEKNEAIVFKRSEGKLVALPDDEFAIMEEVLNQFLEENEIYE
ncbi:hypothetical protein ACWXVL_02600 [Mycoplasma sp. 128]|uniref:hypothetical protein n=1 Tax=Mycoplasma sp. 3341 TaxID=3447506 RepID=UPI003F65BBCE